jgi:thiol-disulfide isomerase/thioredoxin
MRFLLFVLAALFLGLGNADAAEPASEFVEGQVVDESGQPVAGVQVSFHWGANGSQPESEHELTTPEEIARYWGNVGEMVPAGEFAVTDQSGKFRLKRVVARRKTFMALTPDRKFGSLGLARDSQPLVLKLKPTHTVRGSLVCDARKEKLGWTAVQAVMPDPDHRQGERLVFCGSVHADFEFRLPPGAYELQSYGTFFELGQGIHAGTTKRDLVVDEKTPALVEQKPIALEVSPSIHLKLDGKWIPLSTFVGQELPPWSIGLAKGAAADVNIDSYRGRWTLVYFWSFTCGPCVNRGLPQLMAFNDAHPDGDHHAVVSFALDSDLKAPADIEAGLARLDKSYHGKRPGFPILVDRDSETLERYGIDVFPTIAIVDPKGKLAWVGHDLKEAIAKLTTEAGISPTAKE